MRHTFIVASLVAALAAGIDAAPRHFPVENGAGLEFVQVVPQTVTYRGHKALRLVAAPNVSGERTIALLTGFDFTNGVIDVDVAGQPAEGAVDSARGFVGLAFRAAPNARAYDCFYIRPTNGRADDQLRRNHSTQYVSEPDYPWQRLRTETPGVYESYADLETGGWTHLRIEVRGARARLFVNRAPQPVLIVNDVKRAAVSGQLGLWIGLGTEAYFRNLQVDTN
jgi:hypothetical protein